MLENVLASIRPVDADAAAAARARHDTLTKPPGSLGKLEALGVRLAAVQRSLKPHIRGAAIAVFAGDHGVTDAGVSAYPRAVTEQMVLNFLGGGAAINALSRVAGAELWVVDVGVDANLPEHPTLIQAKVRRGSRNFLHEPALTDLELSEALDVGIRVANHLIDNGANLLVGGDMGIGNSTPAAAITAALTGHSPALVTGRGTGVDDAGLRRKVEVIERALAKHQPDPNNPLSVLAALGGLEIAALTGFYLGAASKQVAVILDGFIVTSAALVAAALNPEVTGYLFASHTSQEPGHLIQLNALGLTPLFDFQMRLGEGSGAALSIPLFKSAAAVLSEMATFGEAGVAEA